MAEWEVVRCRMHCDVEPTGLTGVFCVNVGEEV